jgi:hypothetical protein
VDAKPPSPPAWPSLMRLAALQGLVSVRPAEPSGSPHPLRPRRFRRDPRSLPDAVPRSLALTGHPLVSFTPLQSPPLHIRRRRLQRQRLPWGCGPSSRHHRPASMLRASQLPPPFRPRRFTRPRRFAPPSGSWVCFTPLPRPGFALQGMSLARSRAVSSTSRALSSLAPPRCSGCPKRHTSSPRPQGFSSVRETVVATPGFSRRRSSIPSWASPPPGAQSRRRADAFTPAAALDLEARSSLSLAPPIFSVHCRRARHPLPRLPTCSRFFACRPALPCVRAARRGLPLTSQQLNRAANRFRKLLLARGVPTAPDAPARARRVVLGG